MLRVRRCIVTAQNLGIARHPVTILKPLPPRGIPDFQHLGLARQRLSDADHGRKRIRPEPLHRRKRARHASPPPETARDNPHAPETPPQSDAPPAACGRPISDAVS